MDTSQNEYDDAEAIAAACANISIMTGNIGRAGGGVAAFRGPANYQGVTDMGFVADMLPGGAEITDMAARSRIESLWGQTISTEPGVAFDDLVEAIESGRIKAMWVEGGNSTRNIVADQRLFAALQQLELLIVTDFFDSPLTAIAHVVLPMAMHLEKDGTFTNFDRTVQRVRAAVPTVGESRDGIEIISELASRMGYDIPLVHPSRVMGEISQVVPGYAGVTYARLERGGIVTPNASLTDSGTSILFADSSRHNIVMA
jgi:predicted molibdopterin-dependent oxidoreductase YjgC